MTLHTFEKLVESLHAGIAEPVSRPSLLYSSDELSQTRFKLKSDPKPTDRDGIRLEDRLEAAAETILAKEDLMAGIEILHVHKVNLESLVEAQLAQPREVYQEVILRLMRAYAEAPHRPGWVARVHLSQTPDAMCDHCCANTAAAMVMAMEALGPDLTAEDEEYFTERIYQKCLRHFLKHCEDRSIFWATREYRWNWRIMTCGDAGLAALALKSIPDRERIIEFAMEGVVDILDWVPPEGDWEEGASYWTNTLNMGLRFALALRNLTDGRVDLFEHPVLAATGEFLGDVMPGGPVFNYADCHHDLSLTVLHLLARETRLGHLARTSRNNGYRGFMDLLYDDPSVEATAPAERAVGRVYPATGIAVARDERAEAGLYVGFKSGPTAVGHSHLDIQSFVVAKGDVPLIIDPGIWPYAHSQGFFDKGGGRWDFDANATLAHNTVLVDGRGQTFGEECGGEIISSGYGDETAWFVSEAASAYPGLLERFRRWLVFAAPDVVLVYDELEADEPRHWEWLLHPAGSLTSRRTCHLIENQGVELSLTRLLPEPETAWRNTAEPRTSYYNDENGVPVERTIDLHRFGPMFPSERIEFLWAMHVGELEAMEWSLLESTPESIRVTGHAGDGQLRVWFDKAAQICTIERL